MLCVVAMLRGYRSVTVRHEEISVGGGSVSVTARRRVTMETGIRYRPGHGQLDAGRHAGPRPAETR